MTTSLEDVLRRVQAVLQHAVVAGVEHADHALREAASYGPGLAQIGLGNLCDQLEALVDAGSMVQAADQRANALAATLRSVDLALIYLLRPDNVPSGDLIVWPYDSVLLERPVDLQAAVESGSALQWAWALNHFRHELSDNFQWLLRVGEQGNITARRRAIEALSFIPEPAVIDNLVAHLDDRRVHRSIINGLVRLAAPFPVNVIEGVSQLLYAEPPAEQADSAALTLFRIAAHDELSEHRQHASPIVRSYATLASGGHTSSLPSIADDPVAEHILRCQYDDWNGGVDSSLLMSLMGLQKEALSEICLYLTDTDSGARLLDHARRSLSRRIPRGHRQRACLALGALGDARDVPLLMSVACKDLPEAYRALGMIGGQEVYGFLTRVINGDVPAGHVGPAIRALGQMGDARAIPRLVGFLKNQAHDRAAATALAAMGAREAVPHLIERITRAQPFEISTYVEALIKIGDPAAVTGFVEALKQYAGRLSASRTVLMRGLVHFGDHAVDAVRELLDHENSRIAALAEEVLTNIDTRRSTEALSQHLERDPVKHLLAKLTYGSVAVRQQAQRQLTEMNGGEIASIVGRTLSEGPDVPSDESRALLNALNGLHHPELVPILRRLARRQNIRLTKGALKALSSFPYAVSRPVFFEQLASPRIADVRRAAQTLGHHDVSVTDIAVDQLSSDNPHLRAGALMVLGAKRARWAADLAFPLFDDPHPQVRLALVSNLVGLSVPRLEEDITARLVGMLDERPTAELLKALIQASETVACASGREDVHAGLVSALQTGSRHQGAIFNALGAVGHSDARDLLLSQLTSSRLAVLQNVASGLARLGDVTALTALENAFDYVTATPHFRALHEALARLSRGWHRLFIAQMALNRNNAEVALVHLDDYLADNPEDSDAYLLRGHAHHLSGRIHAPYDDYLQATRNAKQSEPAWQAASLAAQQLGDVESALDHLNAKGVGSGSNKTEARFRRGLLHLERLDYGLALTDFRAVLGPRSVASTYQKRVAKELIEIIGLLRQGTPDQPPDRFQLLGLMDRRLPNRLADVVLIWALILVRRFDVAKQCLDRFAERWPENQPYTLLNTAWLYAAAGETERAQESLRELEAYAVHRGYHWPDYGRLAFAEWPVVGEPLTSMLLDSFGSGRTPDA